MDKEKTVEVPKVWGKEVIFVNNGLYAGKILSIDKGAEMSYHCHKIKTETFFVIDGTVGLTVDNKGYMMSPFARAKTIHPGEYHSVSGLTNANILEVSDCDYPEDSYRLTESRAGYK